MYLQVRPQALQTIRPIVRLMRRLREKQMKEPAKKETLAVLEAAREMGVLIGKGGIDGNVLRIKPPMCITADDADFTLDVLDRALTAIAK